MSQTSLLVLIWSQTSLIIQINDTNSPSWLTPFVNVIQTEITAYKECPTSPFHVSAAFSLNKRIDSETKEIKLLLFMLHSP